MMSSNEKKERLQWSELPQISLEKIFSFLSRKDRINMSLVCRKWAEGYGSPSVWKTFKFELMPRQLSMNGCPELKFARKYSKMFRRVEISYVITLNKALVYIWCMHFIDLLQILKNNSQLQSVKICGLFWCFAHIDKPTRGDLIRAISAFIRSQPYLKRVELQFCFYKFKNYLNLLKQLPENSRNTLTYLEIEGLDFCDPMDKETELPLAESLFELSIFPRLKTLGMDYSWNIFSRQTVAMRSIRHSQFRFLSKIILKCYNGSLTTEYFRRLTSTDWQFLRKEHPDLEVELKIRSDLPKRAGLELFVTQNMPIKRLKYNYDNRFDDIVYHRDTSYMEINELFDHLLACKIQDQLESLCLMWPLPISLASNFISFLQACKKLKCLELCLKHPENVVDLLMESCLENRPNSLRRVILDISRVVNEDDYSMFMNLTNEYKSRLEAVGINLVVNLKPLRLRKQLR